MRLFACALISLAIAMPELLAAEAKVNASIGELFASPAHNYALISPSGRFAALDGYGHVQNPANGKFYWHRVLIVDSQTGQRATAFLSTVDEDHIRSIHWVDDDSLIVTNGRTHLGQLRHPRLATRIVDIDAAPDGMQVRVRRFGTAGRVIDVRQGPTTRILFAPQSELREIHRIFVSDAMPTGSEPELVVELPEDIIQWGTDSHGDVRVAFGIGRDPEAAHVWVRSSLEAPWRIVYTETDSEKFDSFLPLGFTADGERLLVASDVNRDRYGLFEYDPDAKRFGKLLYEHDTAQLVDVLFDYSRDRLLGAVYQERGTLHYAYFDDEDQTRSALFEQAFPGRLVEVTSLSRDHGQATLRVSGPQNPGAFHHFDLRSGSHLELAMSMPWLANNRLSNTRFFRVRSEGDLEVDAFLTLPAFAKGKPPLVVMPHGGPFGVLDLRGFLPEVQYIAGKGLAVLRVNYRGSGGYGHSFEAAGNRQWGRGIEADIEAAIDRVVAEGLVDGDRICTVGASYGGYSALMLVVRRPKAYRCAASLNGVTDIALMFNSSDWSFSEDHQRAMAEIVGDPDADYAEQRSHSPAYNADKIRIPVHLAHGQNDLRVDIDHMFRMRAMLRLQGTPVEVMTLPMGHGFEDMSQLVNYYTNLRAFLAEHLLRHRR